MMEWVACSVRASSKKKSRTDFRTGGGVGEPRERGIAKGVLTPLCPSESACTFDSDWSEAEIAVKGTMVLLSARK